MNNYILNCKSALLTTFNAACCHRVVQETVQFVLSFLMQKNSKCLAVQHIARLVLFEKRKESNRYICPSGSC